ncbi:PREDICTED: uncharacterized protein LOC104793663 [Camelina sativa]|uniref:Uncharacterized protein LOC104793663 n=1 Tax=Camelina sativa TaxID=90675 RepID=A0ABM0ZNT6_CAMSA|nr:PREDICTED: uncharacterized protein LOC104793663 [Camelina sativa]XP_010518368.1 PREDICTED: uncharacterized protein LOC104793663 [Camelina sativa]XP_010518369.1 PREDICTED: uncharacterized protein LOC104793663 [Camelina sativa]
MVTLTSNHELQCVRWDCRRQPERALEYCGEICREMANSDSQSELPFFLANSYSSVNEFSPVAAKILDLLRAEKESGVPRLLSEDVFHIPPWRSGTFEFVFSGREDFCQWMFIGSHQIPSVASGFNWIQGRSRVISGVRHCVLDPSPREDSRWKPHRYSRPDVMGKAVYVMHCCRN